MQRHFVEKTQLDHNFLFLFFCGSRAMQKVSIYDTKIHDYLNLFYKYICTEKDLCIYRISLNNVRGH